MPDNSFEENICPILLFLLDIPPGGRFILRTGRGGIDKRRDRVYDDRVIKRCYITEKYRRRTIMPPKPKFTKEDIAAAAFDIIKKGGVSALTARELGKKL